MSELGRLLRELRGKDSLREASKKTGVSHTYLSIIEKGHDLRSGSPVKPAFETLRSISKAYHYPYEELLRVAGYIDGDNSKDNEDELLEGIDLELTDDELLERFNISLDGMKLSEDESKEIIAYLRTRRAMK